MVVKAEVRLVGYYHGDPVFDQVDDESDIRCPQCGLMAGDKDETHSGIQCMYFTCTECGYSWQEVSDIPDWREER